MPDYFLTNVMLERFIPGVGSSCHSPFFNQIYRGEGFHSIIIRNGSFEINLPAVNDGCNKWNRTRILFEADCCPNHIHTYQFSVTLFEKQNRRWRQIGIATHVAYELDISHCLYSSLKSSVVDSGVGISNPLPTDPDGFSILGFISFMVTEASSIDGLVSNSFFYDPPFCGLAICCFTQIRGSNLSLDLPICSCSDINSTLEYYLPLITASSGISMDVPEFFYQVLTVGNNDIFGVYGYVSLCDRLYFFHIIVNDACPFFYCNNGLCTPVPPCYVKVDNCTIIPVPDCIPITDVQPLPFDWDIPFEFPEIDFSNDCGELIWNPVLGICEPLNPCPPGLFRNTDGDCVLPVLPCPPGTVYNFITDTCEPIIGDCPPGQVMIDGVCISLPIDPIPVPIPDCDDCPPGYQLTEINCECVEIPCPEGYYRVNDVCIPIPPPPPCDGILVFEDDEWKCKDTYKPPVHKRWIAKCPEGCSYMYTQEGAIYCDCTAYSGFPTPHSTHVIGPNPSIHCQNYKVVLRFIDYDSKGTTQPQSQATCFFTRDFSTSFSTTSYKPPFWVYWPPLPQGNGPITTSGYNTCGNYLRNASWYNSQRLHIKDANDNLVYPAWYPTYGQPNSGNVIACSAILFEQTCLDFSSGCWHLEVRLYRPLIISVWSAMVRAIGGNPTNEFHQMTFVIRGDVTDIIQVDDPYGFGPWKVYKNGELVGSILDGVIGQPWPQNLPIFTITKMRLYFSPNCAINQPGVFSSP